MIKRDNLEEIININKKIQNDVESLVKKDLRKLYDDNLTVVQKINLELEKNSIFIKFPVDAPNLGGFIYKKDNNDFCYINSNQIRVFQNFVSIHEYYHLMYSLKSFLVNSNEENSIHLEERKANYYASLMSLDEESLRMSFNNLKLKTLILEEILCYLIDLYKVPKKTILLRLYEINCIDFDMLYKNFETNISEMKNMFKKLGLDKSCLEPSGVVKIYDLEQEIAICRKNKTILDNVIDSNEKYFKEILNEIQKEQD